MILLDTNVVSETMKPAPDPKIMAWLATQPTDECFVSSITEPELRFSVELLPAGQRRERFQLAVDQMFRLDFAGRVLPFESAAASAYSLIVSHRRRLGKPIGQLDGMIAAIARSVGSDIATRNIRDFSDCGVILIDPWNP